MFYQHEEKSFIRLGVSTLYLTALSKMNSITGQRTKRTTYGEARDIHLWGSGQIRK